MKIISIVGTRPNILKVAALQRAFQKYPHIDAKLIHTGQHYDDALSQVFFRQLNLPEPDYQLSIGAGSINGQTAQILLRLEPILQRENPDWLVVVGDVTSTMAAALAANRLGIRVAHVEAGLRSGDRQMPEETNRILTDSLAEKLFVTEPAGLKNLRQEGIVAERTHLVGNVLIDTLHHCLPAVRRLNLMQQLGLEPDEYWLLTMHRPVNVDTEKGLVRLLKLIRQLAECKPVVLPLHPRTRASLAQFGLLTKLENIPGIRLLQPLGYLEFLHLLQHSAAVLTDSGGVQEEATVLSVPCITLRTTTERPITLTHGTNQLLPTMDANAVLKTALSVTGKSRRAVPQIPGWDGRAAERIVDILLNEPSILPALSYHEAVIAEP